MIPATFDKYVQHEESVEETERASKNRMKMVIGCAKKLPVIIDRLAIMFYIVLEIFFYYAFIPK